MKRQWVLMLLTAVIVLNVVGRVYGKELYLPGSQTNIKTVIVNVESKFPKYSDFTPKNKTLYPEVILGPGVSDSKTIQQMPAQLLPDQQPKSQPVIPNLQPSWASEMEHKMEMPTMFKGFFINLKQKIDSY